MFIHIVIQRLICDRLLYLYFHLVIPRLVSNMRRNSAVAECPRIEAQSADFRPMSFWKILLLVIIMSFWK